MTTTTSAQWTEHYLRTDDGPFIVLGAEVHNSSSSSLPAITESFATVHRLGANTVLAPVAWDLFEPEEGRFDTTLIDAMIETATDLGLRLVPLWFGAWKNAVSTYAPGWVKTDQQRFPRALSKDGARLDHLTPFCDATRDADGRAFAALMRRITEKDRDGTVLMVQIENEIGLLGATRDYSDLAEAAFAGLVPDAVVTAVQGEPGTPVHLAWMDMGRLSSGTWTDVFGDHAVAHEAFMAAAYAAYVQEVAAAGREETDLPYFVNAWLDADSVLDGPVALAGGKEPGEYPSGGPVARVAGIWEALAPQLDLLAPDMYVADADPVFTAFAGRRNRLFIPELRADAVGIGQMFAALGSYRAIGVSPFGIDSLDPDDPSSAQVVDTYGLLAIAAELLRRDPAARTMGFMLDDEHPDVVISFPSAELRINTRSPWIPAQPVYPAYGIAIEDGDGVFVIGRGFWVTVEPSDTGTPSLLSADEYSLIDRELVVTRRLNGDETAAGSLVPFPFANSPMLTDRVIPTRLPDAGAVRFRVFHY